MKGGEKKMETIIIVWIIFGVIFGFACSSIAKSKNRDNVGWFFGGLFLGLIGLIIVALLPNLDTTKSA
jgi:uncharacterized membrane protein YeaQ/YmgE (transglycosylase-associated protein family)